MINILRGCNIKMCCVCMHSEVYTHTSHTVCVCGEDLVVNGSDQAESYLLFHVGFDFPPRGEEDTSCITTERKCISIYPSIYLHRFFIVSCMQTTFLSHLGFTCRILILVYFCVSQTVIRAKISGEKIVSPSNSSSPYMKMIQYEIKMIKVRALVMHTYPCPPLPF